MSIAEELDLTSEDVIQVLKSKLNTDDFKMLSWELRNLSDGKRSGFAAEHYRLICNVCHPSSSLLSNELTFFAKTLPHGELRRESDIKTGMSRKEHLFYELLAQKFANLVKENQGSGFQSFLYPGCYLIKENIIILDFLGPEYKLLNQEDLVNDLHAVKLVVSEIAKFHAASLILEEQSGKRISELFPEMIYETIFDGDPSHPNASWHQGSIELVVKFIPLLEKYNGDEEKVKRIQESLPSLMREMFQGMLAWPKERNVMVHGDLWINNLMFRYENGKPVQVVFVDFQFLRYTIPAHDLTTFLMFCADKPFWDRYINELIDLYWESLSSVISNAGYDINKILPKSDFKRTMNEMKKIALIEMAMEYPLTLAPTQFLESIMKDPDELHIHAVRTELVLKMFHEDSKFRSWWTDVLEELIDNHILKRCSVK